MRHEVRTDLAWQSDYSHIYMISNLKSDAELIKITSALSKMQKDDLVLIEYTTLRKVSKTFTRTTRSDRRVVIGARTMYDPVSSVLYIVGNRALSDEELEEIRKLIREVLRRDAEIVALK